MDSIYSGVSGGVTMRKTSVRDEDEISEARGEQGKLAVDTSVGSVETYKADIGASAEVQGESDEVVR